MARMLRWAGYAIGALVLLLLIAAATVWLLSSQKLHGGTPNPEHLAKPTAAEMAGAPRMLTVLRCAEDVTGYREVRYPKMDAARTKVDLALRAANVVEARPNEGALQPA